MALFRSIVTPSKHFFAAEYSTTLPGLLSDISVLDLTRVVAGPFCTMTLGDLGANVIKVESLSGDESRKWGPPFMRGDTNKDSFYFLAVNRNKKSICVDLKLQEGKDLIYDLAQKCDVVVENYLPGKLDELRVGYEELSRVNPELIYCAITGFGPTGPYAKKPGYDVIAAAMGGLLHVTGERRGRPCKPGVALTDLTTGLHGFGAIMTALYYRQKTGKGQKIDCNLLSTQVSSMINLASVYLNCGIEGQRWGTAHANLVPYQAFQTKDGELVIGTGSNAQFADFCKIIGKEELVTDERFVDNSNRVKNREIIIDILSDIIKMKTNREWMELFKNASFPHGPVNKMKDVFEDDHIKAIGLVKELPHQEIGKVKVVGPPTVYSAGGNYARTAPPTIGQHTREVLAEFLGYDEKKIEGLYEPAEPVAVITLRARAPRKKVVWTDDTVDNEHLNKKKSKCCCIYEKPKAFGESDSEESDDECEHCFGHVEKRHAKQAAGALADAQDGPAPEPTATVTLQPSPTPAPAPSSASAPAPTPSSAPSSAPAPAPPDAPQHAPQ